MAEFALGLTRTAVEGTLSRVKLAIEEETKLRVLVQNDLVFITGEFEMMRSFLNVANKERAKNEVVRAWVSQVRNLAFDVEDCVEFVVHLDNKSAWGWLRRLWHSVYWRAPPLPLDVAVSEIKQLKARVEDVSQRNTRYNLISDSGSSYMPIMPASAERRPAADSSMSASALPILRKLWEATGRQRSMCNLKALITSEGSDLQVITVWGSSTESRVGTTAIFRKAYYDPEICHEFKFRAWVKLIHPFNPDEFMKSLLTQFRASSRQANVAVGVQAKMKAAVATDEELMQQVTEQRYLVILDEVSAAVEWDVMKMYLPDSMNGSRIVVSTQDVGIALLCIGEPYQVSELKRFSSGQSISVFFKKDARRRRDMGELFRQLRLGGVFSVLETGRRDDIVRLLEGMYECLEDDEAAESHGLKFEHRSWLQLEGSLHEQAFAENLLKNFHPDDDQDEEVGGEEIMEAADPIQLCRNILCEKECLVVIIGLKSTEDWDKIKSVFLSELSEGSCVLAFTDAANVATYCADHEYRVLKGKDLLAEMYSLQLNAEREYCDKAKEEDKGDSDEDPPYACTLFNGLSRWNKKNCEMSLRMKEGERCLKEFKLLERQKEMSELWRLCKKPPRVISVWGIAGVGKSVLVRELYYGKMLRLGKMNTRKFNAYSWVDVPQPFDLKEFAWRLLVDFHSDDLQAKETAIIGMLQGQDPIEDCCRFLQDYQGLVVIDGLQSKDDWNSIRSAFLCEPTNACIIVITNEESVATYCADVLDKRLVVNVKGLEDDVALRLFKKIAWDGKQHGPLEEELSRVAVTKCGGLPKIIAAIGEYFKGFNYYWVAAGFEAFGDFMVALETYPDPVFTNLRGLFSWMQQYFDSCSDSLKPCIFYLPVFPTNKKIRRRRLLRRWIAEGYSRDTPGFSAEEHGSKFFSQLIDLSIIQCPHPKISLCKVNGFFYEYIVSRPMEDNLVFALEGQCSRDSQHTVQHLTVRSSWVRDEIVFKSIDFSRLRSLTVFGEWKSFFISTSMKLLRVLDLEDASGVTNDDLEQLGKILCRLKFLSLRGCTKISRLPNSLGGMRQLQTLDIRYTSIVKLPSAITKLQELQYIRAGTTHEDWTSTPPENAEGIGMPAEDVDMTLTSEKEAGDAAEPSQPVASAPRPVEEVDSTGPPAAAVPTTIEDGNGTGPGQPTAANVVWTSSHSRTRPHHSVYNWLSKSWCIQRFNKGSVKAPAGIGNLVLLHTLGVVDVSGASGKTILKELKKLTKLHKLGLAGINRGNIQQFCSVISGHAYLESLSVQVDKDEKGSFVSLDGISQPPNTLKSLKLYGHVHKMPIWFKELDHLKKLHLEMTILTQEDLDVLNELPGGDILRCLCLKLIQDGELCLDRWNPDEVSVLKIDCSSNLEVTFSGYAGVELLILHCSSGSSLGISGLEKICGLKEVWLRGSYGEELERSLRRQIAELPEYQKKPVLKLEQPHSSWALSLRHTLSR